MSGTFDDTNLINTLSIEQKLDAILEGLAEIQDQTSRVSEMADQVQDLTDKLDEVGEILKNVGFDNPGFSVDRYDN